MSDDRVERDYEYLDEWQSGYEDAPKWFWAIVRHTPGWRGDVTAWATMFVAGIVAGLAVAVVGLWLVAR